MDEQQMSEPVLRRLKRLNRQQESMQLLDTIHRLRDELLACSTRKLYRDYECVLGGQSTVEEAKAIYNAVHELCLQADVVTRKIFQDMR